MYGTCPTNTELDENSILNWHRRNYRMNKLKRLLKEKIIIIINIVENREDIINSSAFILIAIIMIMFYKIFIKLIELGYLSYT